MNIRDRIIFVLWEMDNDGQVVRWDVARTVYGDRADMILATIGEAIRPDYVDRVW